MKKTVIFCIIVLCPILAINGQLNVNKLKDKAKNISKTENNSSSSDNSTNDNSGSTSNEDIPDGGYKDFVDEKYNIIQDNRLLEPGAPNTASFLKTAQELDYPATYKKLKEKGQLTAVKGRYQLVLDFGENFKKVFDDSYKSEINSKIEEAYKKKKFNESEAVSLIKDAKTLVDAVLLVIPDYESAKTLKTETDNAYNELASNYEKKVYTSDFHKKNGGKILFSKSPIVITKEDPNQITDKFTANDNIYAMIYFNGTISELQNNYDDCHFDLMVDGQRYDQFIEFKHNPEDMKYSWHAIEIIPEATKAIHEKDCKEFAQIITGLSPRKHTFKIIYTSYNVELASGEITLDLSGMDADKINANAEKASTSAKDNYDRSRQLPDVFKENGPKYTDPELSETNLRALMMKAWGEKCAQILKIVYYQNDQWELRKNDAGIPESKLKGVRVLYKGKDGWCYYVEVVTIKKDYEGAGTYGKAYVWEMYSVTPEHIRLECKNCQ